MKSETAKKYIRDFEFGGHGGYRIISSENAKRAIELAEVDARERAVSAVRKVCPLYDDGREFCWGEPEHRQCEGRCNLIDNFLKHYDNE